MIKSQQINNARTIPEEGEFEEHFVKEESSESDPDLLQEK